MQCNEHRQAVSILAEGRVRKCIQSLDPHHHQQHRIDIYYRLLILETH